jgi:hypothetical protein
MDTARVSTAMDLLAQLVGALELREASDPDAPAWAAEREIQRLEHDIVVCLRDEAWHYDADASGREPRGAATIEPVSRTPRAPMPTRAIS